MTVRHYPDDLPPTDLDAFPRIQEELERIRAERRLYEEVRG